MSTLYKNYDTEQANQKLPLASKININNAQTLPFFDLKFNESIEKASYVNKILLVN